MHLTPSFTWNVYHDHLNYHRGMLDTVATRNSHTIASRLKWVWKIDRAQSLDVSASYTGNRPDITEMVDYTDSRDPLDIKVGNRHLKNSGVYEASVSYLRFFPHQQIMFNPSLTFAHDDSPFSSIVAYDSATGAYTTSAANVKGGNRLNASIEYDHCIGLYFRVRNSLSGTWQSRYAYLTLDRMDAALTLNRQNTFVFGDNLTVSFETDNVGLYLFGNLSASRYHYKKTPEFNSHPLNIDCGLTASFKIGKFNIGSTITDEYRHGYLSSTINRHRWIWGGDARMKVLKNKGVLAVGMDDILNQKKMNWSNVSAYEREEYWSKSLSHYVYVEFTYNFSPREKKRR